ncbi:MAG TPA: serine/threonine-protein kinase [Bryobacteraceae bacterium]|nr:serine/threonine-protein kinase [Bryobacteraceae bacterium]
MEKIGRYQVLGELGRGAMGIVYRAQDPTIGRIIAIKTIRLSDLTEEAERERLRDRLFREAQSAGILSHPNIVTIYDIAEENGLAFVFMEFVNGPPLEKLLSGANPPDNDTILNIFRQTAAALDYAHKKGIVHRDIKPANIMVHDDGQAKITDFGVAKILSHQMTQSGTMMGTPSYMSPEQIQGHSVDGRADQFALGVIAYEILTGEKPFAADYLPTLLYKIVREDPVPPQRLNPTLSPQVEAVFRRVLAKSPEARYPNCIEFVNALRVSLNMTPGWEPLAKGVSQNMPTLGGAVANTSPAPPPPPAHAAKPELPPPPPAPPTPAPVAHGTTTTTHETHPLLKGLIWVLVGIGVVGLVLLGAQKLLFNTNDNGTTVAENTPTANPAPKTPTGGDKPSPMQGNQATDKTLPGDRTPDEPKPEAKPPEPKPPEPKPTEPEQPPHRTPPAPTSTNQPPSETQYSVQFVTDPVGAKVTIDHNSSLSCPTPCILSLNAGRHVADVQIDGYRSYPRILNVPQDSDVFLKLAKSSGSLAITSSPTGASIVLNGEEQNQKTPSVLQLKPGHYRVRVQRNGAAADFEVDVRDGELVQRNVNFPQ